MKIAVSAQGGSLSALVEGRFGRSPYYVFKDTEGSGFEAFSNPNVNVSGGAGPQTAMLLERRGTEVVLTGRVGPNARRSLEASGIRIVEGADGTVQEAIDEFCRKEGLQP